jgi:hypothetical protein
MILISLLCVCLLLLGFAVSLRGRAVLGDLWLHWFGVRQQVRRSHENPYSPRSPGGERRQARYHPHDRLPPPQVITRPGSQ